MAWVREEALMHDEDTNGLPLSPIVRSRLLMVHRLLLSTSAS